MRRLTKEEFDLMEQQLETYVDLNNRVYDDAFHQPENYHFYGEVYEEGYESMRMMIKEALTLTNQPECYLISGKFVYPQTFLYLFREEADVEERTDIAIELADVSQGLSHFLKVLHDISHKDVILESEMIYLFIPGGEVILIGDHGLNLMLVGIHKRMDLPITKDYFQSFEGINRYETGEFLTKLDTALVKRVKQKYM